MAQRLLDVGNCNADHAGMRQLCEAFKAEIVRAHSTQEALTLLRQGSFSVVTVNRLLDRDGSAGLDLIQAMQQEAALKVIPVMLISNYPEAQAAAIANGAVPGFGKSQMYSPETKSLLGHYLC